MTTQPAARVEQAPIEAKVTEESQRLLTEVQEMVSVCMQCGTCTATCPNAEAMDYVPRRLWRLVQVGNLEEVFNSKTFWLCSTCYHCWVRCPRGIHLTEAIMALKRVAVAMGGKKQKASLFNRLFVKNVQRYGRVQEMKLMSSYFMSNKNPLMPIRFIPLGLKLLTKGKLSLKNPEGARKDKLGPMYKKIKEMEGQP